MSNGKTDLRQSIISLGQEVRQVRVRSLNLYHVYFYWVMVLAPNQYPLPSHRVKRGLGQTFNLCAQFNIFVLWIPSYSIENRNRWVCEWIIYSFDTSESTYFVNKSCSLNEKNIKFLVFGLAQTLYDLDVDTRI